MLGRNRRSRREKNADKEFLDLITRFGKDEPSVESLDDLIKRGEESPDKKVDCYPTQLIMLLMGGAKPIEVNVVDGNKHRHIVEHKGVQYTARNLFKSKEIEILVERYSK